MPDSINNLEELIVYVQKMSTSAFGLEILILSCDNTFVWTLIGMPWVTGGSADAAQWLIML